MVSSAPSTTVVTSACVVRLSIDEHPIQIEHNESTLRDMRRSAIIQDAVRRLDGTRRRDHGTARSAAEISGWRWSGKALIPPAAAAVMSHGSSICLWCHAYFVSEAKQRYHGMACS